MCLVDSYDWLYEEIENIKLIRLIRQEETFQLIAYSQILSKIDFLKKCLD